MASLNKAKKEDLFNLAQELNVEVPESVTISTLKALIENCDTYKNDSEYNSCIPYMVMFLSTTEAGGHEGWQSCRSGCDSLHEMVQAAPGRRLTLMNIEGLTTTVKMTSFLHHFLTSRSSSLFDKNVHYRVTVR
ncbi:hypothetical protein HNY73_011245 [Argiope bruennichi]|uniref:Uncharacterized protein n=1 Tax=Argiope bruennichi TaxID=94029 RepID=A0A8T0F648_ARGBR|nr:hypothetical protein HNY73_011245 [Argiope bruennichi]